jgi:hypothetical protein
METYGKKRDPIFKEYQQSVLHNWFSAVPNALSSMRMPAADSMDHRANGFNDMTACYSLSVTTGWC